MFKQNTHEDDYEYEYYDETDENESPINQKNLTAKANIQSKNDVI